MRATLIGRVATVLLVVALAAPAGAQSFAWWKNEQFKKDVGLTSDQCAKIDQVFQATVPKQREGWKELDRLETELSKMIETRADEAVVVKQVDRVEAQRASLNKTRTLMLLHMRQVLTPDQLVKFKAAHDQWEKDHHRPPRQSDSTQPKKK
jgi:Spy/CpxP family protein refolding chaperone